MYINYESIMHCSNTLSISHTKAALHGNLIFLQEDQVSKILEEKLSG